MKATVTEHLRETFREPVKNCMTCAHSMPSKSDLGESFRYCSRFQGYCSIVKTDCGADLREWRARPPEPPKPRRRSLRRWLYDLFWSWS
jgi:hypothetical protein